jgi:hypothetical protein
MEKVDEIRDGSLSPEAQEGKQASEKVQFDPHQLRELWPRERDPRDFFPSRRITEEEARKLPPLA